MNTKISSSDPLEVAAYERCSKYSGARSSSHAAATCHSHRMSLWAVPIYGSALHLVSAPVHSRATTTASGIHSGRRATGLEVRCTEGPGCGHLSNVKTTKHDFPPFKCSEPHVSLLQAVSWNSKQRQFTLWLSAVLACLYVLCSFSKTHALATTTISTVRPSASTSSAKCRSPKQKTME